MKIEPRTVKSVITKSNIPSIDYVINPYIGCSHACVYCYAEFMIRFTGHKGEKWGQFLDIKQFDATKIRPQKYNGKRILLSSVTDPYIALESKYQNTRKILESLVGTKATITLLSKSKLIERDIDLFQQFENLEAGISITTLDQQFARIIEPGASPPEKRLEAVRKMHENHLKTYIFISPFFPGITDFQKILEQTRDFTDYYMFENLNFRPHNVPRIMKIIETHYPKLMPLYEEIRRDHTRWDPIAYDIQDYCEKSQLEFRIEFHHGGFSKT